MEARGVEQARLARGVMLLTAPVDGVGGDAMLRRISDGGLPPNLFGNSEDSKSLIRTVWHLITAIFMIAGVALIVGGLEETSRFAPGIAYLLGALLTSYAVIALGVAPFRQGIAGLFKHPGPVSLTLAAGLTWWGSTSL